MNTENMNLFCIVYEAGSIARAADSLFLSHQAISRRIASVEAESGAILFDRTPKGLAPTKAGEDAYRTFKSILDSYRRFQERVGASRAVRETIRMAIEFYDIDILNLDAILAFEKASDSTPAIEVRFLANMECYRQLLDGRIDIAITNRPFVNADKFDFTSLQRDRTCIAVSKQNHLATKETLEPGDFVGQTFLAIIDADGTNKAILRRFAEYGVEPLVETITYDMSSLASIIRSNRGFHACPEAYTGPLHDKPGIAVRLLPGFSDIFNLGLVRAKKHPASAVLDEFVSFLEKNHGSVVKMTEP